MYCVDGWMLYSVALRVCLLFQLLRCAHNRHTRLSYCTSSTDDNGKEIPLSSNSDDNCKETPLSSNSDDNCKETPLSSNLGDNCKERPLISPLTYYNYVGQWISLR